MIYELASEWCSGCLDALRSACLGANALRRERARVTGELESLVAEVRASPMCAEAGLLRAGAAAAIGRFEQELVECFSFETFDGYPKGEAAFERIAGERIPWTPREAPATLQAQIEKLTAAVERARPSRSNAPSSESLAELMHRIQSMPRPRAEPPAERPMFYVPKHDRNAYVLRSLWMVGVPLILALISGWGFFWLLFLAAGAYFVACWAITASADQQDSDLQDGLESDYGSLQTSVAELDTRARELLESVVCDMAFELNRFAADAARLSAELLGVAANAVQPAVPDGHLIFGECSVPHFPAALARAGEEADFRSEMLALEGRRKGDAAPSGHLSLEPLREPLRGSTAHLRLSDCDYVGVVTAPHALHHPGTLIASKILTATAPGRARFMFIELGRLAEAYRVFGALNESPSTRLAERLYVTHVSELAAAVDAVRTFIGRTKEAVTRKDSYERRIGDAAVEEGAIPLQRAVIVLDSSEEASWPEKDRRRIGEHLSEIRSLALVAASEGSVLLVDIAAGAADPYQLPPSTQASRLTIHNGPAGLLFEGNLLVRAGAQPSSSELAAACDTWCGETKKVESSLRQLSKQVDWSDAEASNTRYGIEVEIGRHGSDRPARLVLGRDGAHHAICIGRTGSGKTNLFHVVLGNLVRRYAPDELELYLLDFKEGVEFAVYAEAGLPHCRAVAVDADRAFGLSVLLHLKRELNRRAAIFKAAGLGIASLEAYEEATDRNMPRIVLLIDEFQVLLQPGERLAGAASGAAAAALEDLVRRGRSFGLHVILGSQTLAGRELTPATLGQLALRIVLPCSAPDAAALLGEQPIASQLRAPGDAIVWRAGQGEVSDAHLAKIFSADIGDLLGLAKASRDYAAKLGPLPPTFIFRGSGQNDLSEVMPLLHEAKVQTAQSDETIFAVGAPTAFGETAAGLFRNRRGRNMLFVHRTPETQGEFFYSALHSLMQLNPNVEVVICDLDGHKDVFGTPMAGTLARIYPGRVSEVMPADLANRVTMLAQGTASGASQTVLAIAGGERSRIGQVSAFAQLLKDGPERGVHTLVTCDAVRNLERLMERSLLPEFGLRALGPASAGDSQKLLEQTDAEALSGDHQYLFYDDDKPGRLTRLHVLTAPPPPEGGDPVRGDMIIVEATNG